MTEPKDMTEQPDAQNSNPNSKEERIERLRPHQFQPGQSGNPGGRPKRKYVTEIYEELLSDPEIRREVLEAAKKRMLSDRMVGTLELERAAERLEGKVQQDLKIEGELNLGISEQLRRAEERLRRGE